MTSPRPSPQEREKAGYKVLIGTKTPQEFNLHNPQ